MVAETILLAWHGRQIARHLEHLEEVRDRVDDPGEQLAAVLDAYALISHEVQAAKASSRRSCIETRASLGRRNSFTT